jgi:hypothetical protein
MGGFGKRGLSELAFALDVEQQFSPRLFNRMAAITTAENEPKTENQPKKLPELPEVIIPFAPKNIGSTVTSQPTFYWYMSAWAGELEFTLNEVGATTPLIELVLNPPSNRKYKAGLHQIPLKDYNVHLKENRDYEWFLTIVIDPEQRSSDLMASGIICYQPKEQPVQEDQGSNKVCTDKKIFWYDAIEEIGVQLENAPENKKLRQALANLFEQEKMHEEADYLYYH